MKWNEVIYQDCMNEENGLPTLEDKSIDLCITDPPYNISFKGGMGDVSNKRRRRIVQYKDKLSNIEYKKWCYSWFDELKRICKMIIFTPGYKNRQIWFEKEEFELLFWINMMRQGCTKISNLNKCEMIFCWNVPRVFGVSVLKYNYGGGHILDFKNSIHPCPKPRKVMEWIILNTKPKSVIDPFMGSGTTAEVCTKLGIPWIGYEINEIYSQDINKRLKGCVREPQQIPLPI